MNVAMLPPIGDAHLPWACPQCREVAARAHKRAQDNAEFMTKFDTLSAREREVALAICAGEAPQSCADRLGLSVKTVHTYRARILEKLEMTANAQIAIAFERAGLFHG